MKKTINELLLFGALSLIGLCILILRIKLTLEIYYIFLIWNMFLATVPLILVQILHFINKKYLQIALVFSWVIFFPNAPYIITDVLHLQYSNPYHFQMDLALISYCAFYGLVAGFYALQKLNIFFKVNWSWSSKMVIQFNISLFFLSGFGIYIGRFLRWNSWDIVQAPKSLFLEMWTLFTEPITHLNVWLFTIISGFILWLGYSIFTKLCALSAPKLINRYREYEN